MKLVVKALSGLSTDVNLTPQESLLLMVVLYRLQTASTEAGLPPELKAIERSYQRKPGALKLVGGRMFIPDCATPETDLQELAFVRRAEQFANAVYHSNAVDFARDLHLRQHDVLVDNLGSAAAAETVVPSYAVAMDRSSKTLVIAIRGTYSLAEVLINFTVSPEEFAGGFAHRGMLIASEQLLLDLQKKIDLDRFFTQLHPDYRLVCTGHSFGAAASALLATMLRVRYSARAVAFCPPSCVSKELAESCAPYVRSVVNGDDLVPRFHYDAIVHLKEAMKNLDVQRTVLQSLHLDSLLSPAVVAQVLGYGVAVGNVAQRTADLVRNFFELLLCPISHWGESLAKTYDLFSDTAFFLSREAAAAKQGPPSAAEMHAKMPRISNINWSNLSVPLPSYVSMTMSSFGDVQVHLDGARAAIASTVDSAVNAAKPAAAAIARKAAPAVAAVQEAIANRAEKKAAAAANASASASAVAATPTSPSAVVAPADVVVAVTPGGLRWSMSSDEQVDYHYRDDVDDAAVIGTVQLQPASQAGTLDAEPEDPTPPADAGPAATIAVNPNTGSTVNVAPAGATIIAPVAVAAVDPADRPTKCTPNPTRAAAAGSYIPQVELADLEDVPEADHQVAIVFRVPSPPADVSNTPALFSDFSAPDEEFVMGREADPYGTEEESDAAAAIAEWTSDPSGPTISVLYQQQHRFEGNGRNSNGKRVSQAMSADSNLDEDDDSEDSDDNSEGEGERETQAGTMRAASGTSDENQGNSSAPSPKSSPSASASSNASSPTSKASIKEPNAAQERPPDRLQYYPPGEILYLAYPEGYERRFVLQEEKRRAEARRSKKRERALEAKIKATAGGASPEAIPEQDLFPDYQTAKDQRSFSASSRMQNEVAWEEEARKSAEAASARRKRRSKTAEEDIYFFDADDDNEDEDLYGGEGGSPDHAASRHKLMRPVSSSASDDALWRIARDDLGAAHYAYGARKKAALDKKRTLSSGSGALDDDEVPPEMTGEELLGGPAQQQQKQHKAPRERLYSPPLLVDEHNEPYYGPVLLKLRDVKEGPVAIPEGSLIWPPAMAVTVKSAAAASAQHGRLSMHSSAQDSATGSLPLAGPLLSRAMPSAHRGGSADGWEHEYDHEDDDGGYGHMGGSAGAAAVEAAFNLLMDTAMKAKRSLDPTAASTDVDDDVGSAGAGSEGGFLAVLGQSSSSIRSNHPSLANAHDDVDEDEDEYGDVVFNRRGSDGGTGGVTAAGSPLSALTPIMTASVLPTAVGRRIGRVGDRKEFSSAPRISHGAITLPSGLSPRPSQLEANDEQHSLPPPLPQAGPSAAAINSRILPADESRYFNRFVLSKHMLTDHLLMSLRAELDLWLAYLLRQEALEALRAGNIARSQSLPALLTAAIKKSHDAATTGGRHHGHHHRKSHHDHGSHRHGATEPSQQLR